MNPSHISIILLLSIITCFSTIAAPNDIKNIPTRSDGTKNYIAALNHHNKTKTDQANNAFVSLLLVTKNQPWSQAYLHEILGGDNSSISQPTPQYTHFNQFLSTQQNISKQSAYDQQDKALVRPWSRNECPAIKQWLDLNQKSLKFIEQGLAQQRYYAPIINHNNPPLLYAATPIHFQLQRDVAKAFATRATYTIKQNQPDKAWQEILNIKKLARHVSHESITFAHLIAISIEQIAHKTLCQLVIHGNLTPTQTRAMLNDLARLTPLEPISTKINLGERLAVIDLLQFLTRGQGGAALLDVEQENESTRAVAGLFQSARFDSRAAQRYIDLFFDRFTKALSATSPQDAKRLTNHLQKQFNQMVRYADLEGIALITAMQKFDNPTKYTQALAEFLIAMTTIDPAGAYQLELEIRCLTALEPIALAMAAYQHDHGKYPSSLDALAPAYMQTIPSDWADQSPVKYRVESGAIRIYSVGCNFKDDQGVNSKRSDDKSDDQTIVLPYTH